MIDVVAASISESTLSIFASAGIALFASVTAPLLLLYLSGRQRVKDKQMEWERQDRLAAEAKTAAETVAGAAQEAAEKLAAETKRTTEAAMGAAVDANDNTKKMAEQHKKFSEITNSKLDVIHTLVNNNLTTAMQDQLNSRTGERALMQEVIDLNKAAGRSPSPESLAALSVLDGRVQFLERALLDRYEQAAEVERQIQDHPLGDVEEDTPKNPGGGGPDV